MGASFITPGEIIENSSNLTPGKGTIEHEGNIIAMVQGNVIIDSKSNIKIKVEIGIKTNIKKTK